MELTTNTTTVGMALRNTPPPAVTATSDGDEAKAAAEEFEAFFVQQMLELMFTGIDTDPMFGGGPGETAFRSLLHHEYATEITGNGGWGIAEPLMTELLKMQEVPQ